MRKDKVKAYELRRKNKSYSEISRLLSIPKSTLNSWFKREEWSQVIRDQLGRETSFAFPKRLASIRKANRNRWLTIHESYRQAGEQEFESLKSDPLFLASLMLYWGGGDKNLEGPNGPRVKIANNDPRLIQVFYYFLTNVLAVPDHKISLWLLLYPDLSEEMQKKFWSKATGIPLIRFKKSQYIKGRHPKKRLSYGVCNLLVNSRELKEKIMVWLELSQRMLLA